MKHFEFQIPGYIFYAIIFLWISPLQLASQNDTLKSSEQFLFPSFSLGIVKMKSGEKITLMLNYDLVNEKMVFFQKGQKFEMINYDAVDTVFIQRRKFVPAGKLFFEVMVNAPVSFFIQHRGSLQSPPRPAPYGGTSEVSSSTYINNLNMGGQIFRMNVKPEISVNVIPLYWIRNKGEMFSFVKEKQLLRIFSDKKNEMRQYIRQNHLDTEKSSDLIRIVNHYNGFPE